MAALRLLLAPSGLTGNRGRCFIPNTRLLPKILYLEVVRTYNTEHNTAEGKQESDYR
jgi:hypothetical protein